MSGLGGGGALRVRRWGQLGLAAAAAAAAVAMPLVAKTWCAAGHASGGCGGMQSPNRTGTGNFDFGSTLVDELTYTGGVRDSVRGASTRLTHCGHASVVLVRLLGLCGSDVGGILLLCRAQLLNWVALFLAISNYVWSPLALRPVLMYLGFLMLFQLAVCMWPLGCVGVSGVWAAMLGSTWGCVTSDTQAFHWSVLPFWRRVWLLISSSLIATVFGAYPDPFSVTAHVCAFSMGVSFSMVYEWPIAEPLGPMTREASSASQKSDPLLGRSFSTRR